MEHHDTHHDEAQELSPAARHRPINDRFLPISILVAAILIGGTILFATLYRGGSVAPAGAAQAAVPPISAADAVLGNPNAPVTLIEYGDYQCPFCGRFFSEAQPQIVKDYVDTGKVKMVFRNFAFLGSESVAAAEAADCAGDQNKLWAYHDALYAGKVADFAKGGGEDDGFFNRTLFLKIAQQINLNIPTFTSCIDSNKYANRVAQEKTDAAAIGVNSTPTVFINGQEVLGAQPYAAFKTVIDLALQNSK